jgi:hypothetical protein
LYGGLGYDQSLNGATGGKLQRLTFIANHTTMATKKLELSTSIMLTKNKALNNTLIPQGNYPYEKPIGDDGALLPVAAGPRGIWTATLPAGFYNWQRYPGQERALRDEVMDRNALRVLTTVAYSFGNYTRVSLSYQYRTEAGRYNNNIPEQSFTFRDLYNRFAYLQAGIIESRIPRGPMLDWQQDKKQTENWRLLLNTQHILGKVVLNGQAGAEMAWTQIDTTSGRKYQHEVDFNTLHPQYYTAIPAPIPGKPYANGQSSRLLSGYGNIMLSLDNRYTFTGSIRYDGSDAFGTNTNKRIKPLWSAGFKWDVPGGLFRKQDSLDLLSIKITYGYCGNMAPSASHSLTMAAAGVNRYGANAGVILNPDNPDLQPEKIAMLNVGLEFSLFSGRLTGSLEGYGRRGNNLLNYGIANTTRGAIPVWANTGILAGKGIDLQLRHTTRIDSVRCTTTLLLTYTTDKVIRYGVPGLKAWPLLQDPATNFRPGGPVNALYNYPWTGLDSLGNPTGYLEGGASKNYERLTDRLADSLSFGGYSKPTCTVIITQTVQWRNFTGSLTLTGQFGYKYRKPAIDYSQLTISAGPGSGDYSSRWQKPGDEKWTNVPAMPVFPDPHRDVFYQYVPANLLSACNIRLQELRIAYTPGKKTVDWLHVSNMNLYAYAANVGILWKAAKTSLDPNFPTGLPVRPSFAIGISVELQTKKP